MAVKFKIAENAYHDSLRLMRISKTAGEVPGVKNAFAVMATDKAKHALASAGLLVAEIEEAEGSDLVIVVEAESEELAEETIGRIDALLSSDGGSEESGGPDILSAKPSVINVGLEIFRDSLEAQGIKVRHVNWKVPAKGDARLVNLLKKMT